MISETQQEQATLYALELLDADEAVAFERQVEADRELRELVRDLQETAARLAVAGGDGEVSAPPALRDRVLADVRADRAKDHGFVGTAPRLNPTIWLPWALAALFMGCTFYSFWLVRHEEAKVKYYLGEIEQLKPTSADYLLTQISFCALEPTPEFTTAQPRAAVLWDTVHHQGKLRVNRLAPPAEGKDYQLWTVEKDRKDAVSAGVVHVDADGKADISFQPVDADGKPVVAVAISLEQAGGSPTNRGPILLLGKF